MLESCIKILVDEAMSNPSVLGLVPGELIDILENVAPLHESTATWERGLLLILRLLTLRPLQE
jgi:hypothetical protein